MLLLTSVAPLLLPAAARESGWLRFCSDPDVVMVLALLFATVSLGLARGSSLPAVMNTYASAINDVASILLVIAGSGAFKEVLIKSGVSSQIGQSLQGLAIDPLLLAWIVTAAIRVCVGSATVAGLTAAGILAPVIAAGGVDPNLMVLAIGAGSLFCSHVNDSAFWMFK